nr:uncharacterized protein LOC129437577 [Misgurnus anguillicaudatus]
MMASSLAVVPLGLLKMRDFQRWVAARGLCSCRHLARRVRIRKECVTALRQWRDPSLLRTGVPLGGVSLRKVVTTDASLSGWGAVFQSRSVNGCWTPRLCELHINMLVLMAVFLALKHFFPFLEGFHVLVRRDNTTVVAYINRQGGPRSLQLHNLACKLIVWSAANFSSLRATHVPGVLNRGADLLSRGNPLYGEWVLHHQVMDQIWGIYGRAAVDLFALWENAKCPLYFSLRDAPLGVDPLAHPWPNVLLYAFPPLSLISPTLERVRENALSLLLIAPHWPGRPWLAEIVQLLQGEPWPLTLRRDLLSQAGGANFSPTAGTSQSLGLARERLNLNAIELPQEVINTIQSARAPSTRSLYDLKWRVFEDWCMSKEIIPFLCMEKDVLCFLQSLMNGGRAFSTIKVYLAAISACHVGFEGVSVGRHPLICRFMKGERRLRPVSKHLVPS